MHIIFLLHYLLFLKYSNHYAIKAIYWSGDNMTSPLFKMFIMCVILFPVRLICSGNFCNLENILIVCYFTVCVAFCIKMNF